MFPEHMMLDLTMPGALEQAFQSIETSDQLTRLLDELLYGGYSIFPDNGEDVLLRTRHRVGQIGNLTFYVNPVDHNPPHFHIRHPEYDASFRISDCTLLVGNIGNRERKVVEFWFSKGGKVKAQQLWNEGPGMNLRSPSP